MNLAYGAARQNGTDRAAPKNSIDKAVLIERYWQLGTVRAVLTKRYFGKGRAVLAESY